MDAVTQLKTCPLFAGMSERERAECLRCSRSEIVRYEKDEFLFHQQDSPQSLLILLEGGVVVGHDSSDGRRSIIAAFDQPGEMFGEVFLFLNKPAYDHYAQAAKSSAVLQMPKDFLYHGCAENCGYHTRLIANMLSILAQKAYYLNRRLQVVSCTTLRQKIARLLLQNMTENGDPVLSMSREEMADFLNVARPSVSRELMSMQKDGFLTIRQKKICAADVQKLRDLA